ncbi:MAG: LysM peptidoglycan-binding domain-containing protein [Chloroflexota bacterium]|nr:LysM peptidoglycan-binding domain-containing protein [Chloroflexota bacterium]
MRIRGGLCVVVCCVSAPALLLAACGGGSSSGTPAIGAAAPTATLAATLPTPLVLGGGVAQSPGGSMYTVKSGDTLAGIAQRLGISLQDLRAANPSINPSTLSVGQTIKLPAGAAAATPAAVPATDTPGPAPTDTPVAAVRTPTPAPARTPSSLGQTYTVQAGDIPVNIAKKFGITVEALLAANPGLNPTNMHVGDVIVIPPAPAASPTPA